VCHFPPGTSKWNKIEHRLFSQITANWRGRPLVTRETAVELIQATTTRAGLRVRAKLDPRTYVVKKQVTAEPLKRVRIRRTPFRGDGTTRYGMRKRTGNFDRAPNKKPGRSGSDLLHVDVASEWVDSRTSDLAARLLDGLERTSARGPRRVDRAIAKQMVDEGKGRRPPHNEGGPGTGTTGP